MQYTNDSILEGIRKYVTINKISINDETGIPDSSDFVDYKGPADGSIAFPFP